METAQAFAQLLTQQHTLLQAFEDILHTENTTLKGSSVEDINSVTLEKSALLERINAKELELHNVLTEHYQGMPMPTNVDSIFSELDPAQKFNLSLLFGIVQEAFSRCKALNQRNGSIIHLRMMFTEHAIDILNGKPPQAKQSNVVYSADGKTKTQQENHSLVKA